MKRVLIAITGTVAGLVALLSFKTHAPVAASVAGLPATTPSPSPSQSPSPSPSPSSPSPSSPSAKSNAAKTYLGQAVQTPYGVVQVKITVTGSHIDSIRLAQLTAFDSRSEEINSFAAPILVNETMSAQNARIDTVSGATYTSDGYLQSLQSALDKAGIR
ncbi:MAG TPA: FMN-binding protein [Jatrophihabitans sp.]|nr:FMN-binding protein [Jatrophihabitans sp.]